MRTKKRRSRNVKSGVPSMWSISRPGVHIRMSTLLVLPLPWGIESGGITGCRTLEIKRTFSTLRLLRAELAHVRRSVGR